MRMCARASLLPFPDPPPRAHSSGHREAAGGLGSRGAGERGGAGAGGAGSGGGGVAGEPVGGWRWWRGGWPCGEGLLGYREALKSG